MEPNFLHCVSPRDGKSPRGLWELDLLQCTTSRLLVDLGCVLYSLVRMLLDGLPSIVLLCMSD